MRKLLFFLFSHRCLAILRWDLHFLRVRLRNAVTLQGRRIRYFVASRAQPAFLNLGCGPRGKDDAQWVNVDGFRYGCVQFLLDFTRPLPFRSDSFDGVFCEHVFEHFSLQDGERLAAEVYRVLRSGGCVRIVVPDAQLLLRRYFDAPADLIASRGERGDETPMEIINAYFRQRYEHQFLYDWATLNRMLCGVGFAATHRASFGRADHCQSVVLDDQKYQSESLYVEALKP